MYSFRKSKKGFTLIELMVVAAIIGILALLGLRLFLRQQITARNSIVKANAATVHTIVQGNLADKTYASAELAVNSVGTETGSDLANGTGSNDDRPAGMKNPHQTGGTDLVVSHLSDTFGSAALFAADILANGTVANAGWVYVVMDTTVANKFYVLPTDELGHPLGEDVYVATK